MLAQLGLSLATFKIKQMLSAPREEFSSLELNLPRRSDPSALCGSVKFPLCLSLPLPPRQLLNPSSRIFFFLKILPALQFEGFFEVLVY